MKHNGHAIIQPKTAETTVPALCFCGKPIARDSNYRRMVQVRGAHVNVVRDTGCCSIACLERWWADHAGAEDLVEHHYQIDSAGKPVFDVNGLPVECDQGPDPCLELMIRDFVARRPDSLVQTLPVQVFLDKRDCNAWWNTPETAEEHAHHLAALRREADHSGREVISARLKAALEKE